MAIYDISPTWRTEVQNKARGAIPTCDNSSISGDLVAWNQIKTLLEKSQNNGSTFSNTIVSTYSLSLSGNAGGVLASNGQEIIFAPLTSSTNIQKINIRTGIVTTFALVYNEGSPAAFQGIVLASNGDIHLVPRGRFGQKINSSGVVSTYSLIYTAAPSTQPLYTGGVLAPNGDVHFAPRSGAVGQKVSSSGVVSTYSLVYTALQAYVGAVLAPNGDIHFIPYNGVVGQKINTSGVVSTYSLIYTSPFGGTGGASAYTNGVLAFNGDIHFVPTQTPVGQKVNINGVVSTYSLVYSSTSVFAYAGGVLTPNGDIHFVPANAPVGQKISAAGVVSTYSIITNGYQGGVLSPDGDIHFINQGATVGQKISTLPAKPLNLGLCCSPFFNKF